MKLYQVKNKLKLLAKEHFAFTVTVISFTWLIAAYSMMNVSSLLGLFSCFPLVCACAAYYYFYIKSYLTLTDTHSYREYYFDLYRFFGVGVFCIFVICVFAVLGISLSRSIGFVLGFENATMVTMWLLSLKSIIDGMSLGFMTAFELSFIDFKVNSLFGKAYLYILQMMVDLVIISTIWREVKNRLGTKKALKKIHEGDITAVKEFKKMDKSKICSLQKAIYDNLNNEKELLPLLEAMSGSSSDEAQEIHLKLLQEDHRPRVIKHCYDYLARVKKWRLDKVMRKIKPKRKKIILSVVQPNARIKN